MSVLLDRIVARVASHEPDTSSPWMWQKQAATALVLLDRPDRGPEVLFIERASRDGDRWSGQMALPGGFVAPTDAGPMAAAIRESQEEVGIQLGDPIGRLDDEGGRVSDVIVSPFVFVLDREPELELDRSEVASAVWVPVPHLASRDARTFHWYRGMGPFPAIDYEGYTIWGLTHRVVTRFLRLVL
ncbi:MAG: CoA pyrophosphatase [Actinobacteria bacterium]|nr:CoA pyrophosphatase [Actinomycetota bacterium]